MLNFSFKEMKVLVMVFLLNLQVNQDTALAAESGIRPWTANPSYWQFKGRPVLLLGATDSDNLFQKDNIEQQLERLKDAGGNYIRNTMSDRDEGDHRAFAMTSDGSYDLSRWNDEYWRRFDNMLKLASERDIIVQIEIWDRFDHSGDAWDSDPYNPKNNINYTFDEAGLDSLYPSPSNYDQPFFSTIPDRDSNMVLLNFQIRFVEKLLSYSMQYENVLYCIDNETTGIRAWARFWSDFIRNCYGDRQVNVTQMWNNPDLKSDVHQETLGSPERYQYLEISQNSHNVGRLNWDNAQYFLRQTGEYPRPVNSTKIYGSDNYRHWLERGINTQHALQTFFRNVVGGLASSRFHRPPHGLGLSSYTENAIRTVRSIEEHMKMWELTPRMDLLQGAEGNKAYLAAEAGEKYLVYLPEGGKVTLDLNEYPEDFIIRWIITDTAHWGSVEKVQGGKFVSLDPGIEESAALQSYSGINQYANGNRHPGKSVSN
jgi:hypothetical protein